MSTDLSPALLYHVVNTLGWPDLRPMQRAAIAPVSRGDDVLVLAPTAGGKTEAAVFPLLSRMSTEDWHGLTVLYVCPLRALLNNLLPRVEQYAGWLGRRAALWHGDTTQRERRRIKTDAPDILLTTPESIEAMLVSTTFAERELFAGVRTVVVDEVHAFAGDDRGWHLLAVLDRLEHLTGRPLQRVGLSATVGNPRDLMTWLQGPHAGVRPTELVAPPAGAVATAPAADVTLDHVGGIAGAAAVIAALHAGEKRLAFCETRRAAEDLALGLRERGVQTFVSHSSLSRDERRSSEHAFAEARDCVIVATSTLELGVDVGDLDRMIQIDAPRSVASFLQRLGRTGRRAATGRNALLLTTRPESLLQAAGMLLLWGRGFVESVVAPPQPLHIAAQQILAICLERRVTAPELLERWGVQVLAGGRAEHLLAHLESDGHLASDGAQVFVGPKTERQFGRRHFLELLSVFTAAPEFAVSHGRNELGTVDPFVLTRKVDGPRVVVLAGRGWRVTHIDWRRHRCYVEEWDQGAPMRWSGATPPLSYELCRAQRDVVLGSDPPVTLSRRAVEALASVREAHLSHARPTPLVVSDDVWWTWAGARANATLIASLPSVVDPLQRVDNLRVRLREGLAHGELTEARRGLDQLATPDVSEAAIDGLKFSELLTDADAGYVISARLTDEAGAKAVLDAPTIIV